MMSEKLKPCPFCGGEAHLSNWTDQAYVWCECGVKTEVYLHSGCVDKAIEAWNRRAEPERTAKGKWQRRKGSDCWECSQCHAVLENDDLGMHNFYFCYHCGANMMNKSGYMDIEEVHYE